MAKKCIGIDIGPLWIRAVQIVRNKNQYRIERLVTCPMRRSSDSPPEIIKSLVDQHGFDRRASAAVAMPHESTFFRNIETELDNLEKISQHLKSTLENYCPGPAENMLFHACFLREKPDNQHSCLTVTTGKNQQQQRLHILEQADIQCELLDTASFAVLAAVKINHPEIDDSPAVIIYGERSHFILVFTEKGNIVAVRSIPLHRQNQNPNELENTLLTELQISWRKTFSADRLSRMPIFIAGHAHDYANLLTALREKLNCKLIEVDPFARVAGPDKFREDYSICLAEGLALRALGSDKTTGINLLNTTHAHKPFSQRKSTLLLLVLAVSILLTYLTGMFVQRHYLKNQYVQLKNEIRNIFRQTLPNEKNIVDELEQLKTQLKTARQDYQILAPLSPQTQGPLEIWLAINTHTPKNLKIDITQLRINESDVRIAASCDTFAYMYNWQHILQKMPEFASVEIPNPQTSPGDNRARFTVNLTRARNNEYLREPVNP